MEITSGKLYRTVRELGWGNVELPPGTLLVAAGVMDNSIGLSCFLFQNLRTGKCHTWQGVPMLVHPQIVASHLEEVT